MALVIAGISMSLDGYVTGPDVTPEHQLGTGGDVLHRWLWEPTAEDATVLDGMAASVGAILMGRRSYDLAHGDGGWGDGGPAGKTPCFVLTHNPPTQAPDVFTFVSDGIESAVSQAKATAGADRVVGVHGASAAQQCLAAGLLDEIQIHLAPVLLESGTPLFANIGRQFQLERTNVVPSANATHLRYKVQY